MNTIAAVTFLSGVAFAYAIHLAVGLENRGRRLLYTLLAVGHAALVTYAVTTT